MVSLDEVVDPEVVLLVAEKTVNIRYLISFFCFELLELLLVPRKKKRTVLTDMSGGLLVGVVGGKMVEVVVFEVVAEKNEKKEAI